MGITKIAGFTGQQIKFAEVFKVMGHPARMAIIEYLINSPSCICGDIVDELPLAQSTISRHLKELKSVGLINGTIEGNNICYCLNQDVLKEIQILLVGFEQMLKENTTCC